VWHKDDSCIYVTWLIHTRILETCFNISLHTDNFCRWPVTWLIHRLWPWHAVALWHDLFISCDRDMIHSFVCAMRMTHIYMWHDSKQESRRRVLRSHSISRQLLSLPCDMTHSFVCEMRMTHIHMWHDSSIGEFVRRAFISDSKLRISAVTLWHDSFTYVWPEDNSYIHVTCVL